MADTPETSDHTSIKERIRPTFNLAEAIARQTEQQALNEFAVPLIPLLGFEGCYPQRLPTRNTVQFCRLSGIGGLHRPDQPERQTRGH